MNTISIDRTINAPVDVVWESWDDFGNIFKFNPQVKSSNILSSSNAITGMGARRECNFIDGKNWVREEITDYTELQRMTISVYDGSLPVKTMVTEIELREPAHDQTVVKVTVKFEPRMGWVGQILVPLMKRQFRSMLTSLLDGNAEFVETNTLSARAA